MTDGVRYSPCCGLRLREIGRASTDLMEPDRLLSCPCGQLMAVTIDWQRDDRNRFVAVAGWVLTRVRREPAPPADEQPPSVPNPSRPLRWWSGYLSAGFD